MGTRDASLKLRLTQAELDRWRRLAAEGGESLAVFVREATNLRCQVLESGAVHPAHLDDAEPVVVVVVPATTPADAQELQHQAEVSIGKAKTRARGIVGGRNRQTPARSKRKAGCSRARHHRVGVYCRECGTTP